MTPATESTDTPVGNTTPPPAYRQSAQQVLDAFDTSAAGLADAEVLRRAGRYGPNELVDHSSQPAWRLLVAQFTNVMVLVLVCAAGLSMFLGKWLEAGAVLAIVVLFALFGFVQEYRADRAIAALKRLTVPSVRVRRNGVVATVSARTLVPGDILTLEAGNVVPADVRLLDAVNLRVEEAALTGESAPVEKGVAQLDLPSIPLGDRTNMAYLGTIVTQGRGTGVVVATGMQTELGAIARLLQTAIDDESPLQRQLDALGRQLAAAGGSVAVLVLALGVSLGEPLTDMLLTAISIAVAVVPEGLPAVVTFTLAIGAQRMLTRQALIRKLPAVEVLGSVTVVCTDKTGTLTENRMTVTTVDLVGRRVDIDRNPPSPSTGAAPTDDGALLQLLAAGALCNDGHFEPGVDGQAPRLTGDPTETALLAAAHRFGLSRGSLETLWPRVAELPFDSDRKRMTTIHRRPHDGWPSPFEMVTDSLPYLAITKGAVDRLLGLTAAFVANGQQLPLTDAVRRTITAGNDELARRGMRVLGVAVRPLPRADLGLESESELVLLGFVGMFDPPRPDVRAAVARGRAAGIRPVMITGDHPLTATAIAAELGISGTEPEAVVTGQLLDEMDDEALRARLQTASVFARVSATHKIRIVRVLKAHGQIVAMTGDGVNDAPALKEAHVGVAMGITGTDVSKDAADIVLRDDNFSTIVAAVEEGRVVYDNLRRFVSFAVAGNVGKVAVMLGWPLPLALAGLPLDSPVALLPLQLLWLNLMTDGLLGLSMGMEPAEPDVMQRPPRRPSDRVLAGGRGWHALWTGLAIAALTIGVGFWYYRATAPQWQTMMFTSLALLQTAQAFAMRPSTGGLVRLGWSNRSMEGAAVVVLGLQFTLLYSPLGRLMGLQQLTLADLVVCGLLSLVLFAGLELDTALRRGRAVAR